VANGKSVEECRKELIEVLEEWLFLKISNNDPIPTVDGIAVKKVTEVDENQSVTITSLPFEPGSKVEVIILPTGKEDDIFAFTDSLVKKKAIKPLSLKEIEKAVHEVRGVK
jgi:hypothetical protein